ncbi:Phospholipase D1 [Lamellibrachia satsuma]|nr:Phospholipase D1 [Lamellibrachia satsuma]
MVIVIRCVPFSSIHNGPLPFTSTRRHCYMAGQKISVEFAEVEQVERGRLLSPNMYVIQLSHGDYKWTIRKRYRHFRQLHELLLLYRAKMKIPMPMRDHREQRRRFGLRRQILPHFPKLPETLVRPENMEKRKVMFVSTVLASHWLMMILAI